MIELIAVTLFVVLSAIAVVHVHWGSGGIWPCKDLQTLVNTVIGTKGMTRMPANLANSCCCHDDRVRRTVSIDIGLCAG